MHPDPPNESFYQALVLASPDAFMFSDFTGTIRIANPRAAEMGGFDSPDELIGLNLFEFISGQDKIFVAESFEKLARNTRKGTIEATLIRKDGSTYDAELTGSVIRDSNNFPIGLVSITRDITNRKAMEKVLATTKENAEKANLLKDAFISNISHEIRTPLNAILGFTELIKEETTGKVSDETYNYFSIIDFSCNRLIQTVELMLSLSRLQTGMYTPVKKPVNPE
jgi:PAS domain S-box-containing protein